MADPATLALISQIGSGLLSGLSGAMQGGENRQLTREQLAEQRRQFDANSKQRAAEQALVAQSQDPLAQQKSRQKNALVAQLMGAAKPVSFTGNSFSGGLQIDPKIMAAIASYFTPEAAAGAEAQFTANAGAASGGQYTGPSNTGNPAQANPTATNTLTGLPTGRATDRNLFYEGATDRRRPTGLVR